VGVIDHRPSEGGDTPQRQVDFVVQPASSFMAEELTDETNLTESAEGIDQSDNVAVELERKTTACNDSGRSRGRGRTRGCGRPRNLFGERTISEGFKVQSAMMRN
jgi:hypothetical protein